MTFLTSFSTFLSRAFVNRQKSTKALDKNVENEVIKVIKIHEKKIKNLTKNNLIKVEFKKLDTLIPFTFMPL